MTQPNAKRPLCVVLGAAPTGLCVARDLGRHGIPVAMIDYDGHRVGFYSRYCDKRFSGAVANEAELIAKLNSIARETDSRPVLFPARDPMVCAVADHREELKEKFAFSDSIGSSLTESFVNKHAFWQLCQKHGVKAPRSAYVDSIATLRAAVAEFGYPCLLKPEYGHEWRDLLRGQKLIQLQSEADLTAVIDRYRQRACELLVQEHIPGPEHNIWVAGVYVSRDGGATTCFVGRKLRQNPPRFGSASLAESRWNDTVAELSVKLLRDAGFRGICGTEFKYDERDGSYKIIEINQRQTLWYSLISASDVDINYVAYCDLAGLPVERWQFQQRDNVKWAYLEKDAATAVHYWRCGELKVGDWLRSIRKIRARAVFRIDDPMPWIAQTRYFVQRAIASRSERKQAAAAPEAVAPASMLSAK